MLENTNTKQFYPGPILNNTLEITTFLFTDNTQIHVTYTTLNADNEPEDRELTYGEDYEVEKVLSSDINAAEAALTASTGLVKLKNLSVKAGEKITVYRETPLTQDMQYPRTGAFPAASHEGALDSIVMQNQEQQEQIQRSLKVPISVSNFTGDMPSPVPGRTLKINADASRFELSKLDVDEAYAQTNQYKIEAQLARDEALNQANIATSQAGIATDKANASANSATQAAETLAAAVTTIATEKEEAIEAVQNQQVNSIDAVKAQQNTSIDALKAEGTTQVNLAKAEVTKATSQAGIATEQAGIATEQATIATNKTSEVVASGNTALSNIDTAKTGALTDITDLKNTSISNITTTKNNAITAINTEKTNVVNAIKTQQSTSVSAVQNQQTSSVNTVKSTGQSYVDKCKAWASSPNVVEDGLHSAKYYAEMAQGESDVTYEILRASRAYEDKGALLTDEQGYAEVAKYKHSTFDKSKFTVVGSPTITDDGVASGFSSSDYIKSYRVGALYNHSWSIKCPIIKSSLAGYNMIFGFDSYASQGSYLQEGDYISLYARFGSAGSGGEKARLDISSFNSGDFILAELKYEHSTGIYTLSSYDINNVLKSTTDYTPTSDDKQLYLIEAFKDSDVRFIRIGTNESIYCNTSIDLKQFSITVDGVEVFSGNKTGLDVVKPDNYEVVGSPVISDDGVASGFSSSNYVTKDILIDFSQNVVIKGSFTTGKDISPEQAIFCSNYFSNGQIGITMHAVGLLLWTGNSYKVLTQLSNISTNTTYTFEITPTRVIIGNWSADIDLSSCSINKLFFGVFYNTNNAFKGQIDLNAFKIYVDGNLVYQPCLKIPYTESKTGSKIVDEVYRDRVIDLYEQEGQAGYYTIDETNQNFTLPMGEIYGMMGQRSLISSTVTETNRVDIYSDKTCLICGNVATAGTINLPIELANNNYFITLSTSEKTATSFTTTATGDYILIGKVI